MPLRRDERCVAPGKRHADWRGATAKQDAGDNKPGEELSVRSLRFNALPSGGELL